MFEISCSKGGPAVAVLPCNSPASLACKHANDRRRCRKN
jgi:hypothetical protein